MGDAGQRVEGRLHLCGLHPESAHLDLLVGAPERLDETVGAEAGQVSGAVDAGAAARCEGIGNVTALPVIGVTGQVRRTDDEFADLAEACGAVAREDQELDAVDAGAERHRAAGPRVGGGPGAVDTVHRHRLRGLGGAVHVEQVGAGGEPGPVPYGTAGQGVAPEAHEPQERPGLSVRLLGERPAEGRM